jgi:hypothetical protein
MQRMSRRSSASLALKMTKTIGMMVAEMDEETDEEMDEEMGERTRATPERTGATEVVVETAGSQTQSKSIDALPKLSPVVALTGLRVGEPSD